MNQFKLLFSIVLFALLTGCGIFAPDEEGEQPAELVDFDAEVGFDRIWREGIGDGQGGKYNRLTPAISGDVIYAAGYNGEVKALDRATGDEIWEARVPHAISGGVGLSENLVLLGTENARLLALSRDNGETVWETDVSSEVLSAPAANASVVVAQSVDGNISGFDIATGEQIWIYENTVPALTLRGTSTPVIVDGFVIAAFANGQIISVAVDNGTLRWQERIAVPTGRTELERIIDVDAELRVNNNTLVVPSYQGALAQVDVATGQIRWRVDESSYVAAGFGFGNIYISDGRGSVKAYRSGQQETIWENAQLTLRQVSSPVTSGNYVAVGDFEGYLHLLSQVDGRFVGRTRIDRGGLRSIVAGNDGTIYAFGNGGSLVALRVSQ